jgi:hypothetical protein
LTRSSPTWPPAYWAAEPYALPTDCGQLCRATAEHAWTSWRARAGCGSAAGAVSWWGLRGCRVPVALFGQRSAAQVRSRPRWIHHRDARVHPARCGVVEAGWGELPIGWLRCERLVVPAGPAYEHSCGERGQLCGRHPATADRDHRMVAWLPSRDGLVGNGRAPGSGTAAHATTGFGGDPTRPGARVRVHAKGVDSPVARWCAAGVRPGSGAARPGDACMIRSTAWASKQDRTRVVST